jgi:drug/metabolite transporter (DMT)-like permease
MTLSALSLILSAAVLHASWNFCAKRAGGGLPFVYVTSLIIGALYAPALVGYHHWHPIIFSWTAVAWIVCSGGLKTSCALLLQRGYRTGDFSLIYPLARGTGPLLATVAAVALLGERPGPVAVAGGLLIVGSVFFMTGGPRLFHESRAHLRSALKQGVIIGAFIATYTVWDRHGVGALGIPPVYYDAGTAATQLVLLTPFAWRRRHEVAAVARTQWRYAAGVATLSPLAYILVLTALSFTAVSYVAPAREISIVIGAFLGARVLGEADSRRRLLAAVGVTVGVIALAVG